MPPSLSHFAEDIFAEMANRSREAFIEATGLSAEADPAFVRSVSELAICEATFEPVCDRIFDGACRVDVAVRVRPGAAAAFELKLGATRITKTRVDDEWLQPCTPSHGGRRWKGNVIAVLDRRFEGAAVETLGIRIGSNAERLELIRPWCFVARRRILNAWRNSPPSFSSGARLIAFEDVVAAFGGAEAFNGLVCGMLDINFYDEWVARDL